MTAAGAVSVLLPGVLAETAGGARRLSVDPAPPTVAALLEALAERHPLLVRRLRDETGQLRRHVNVYVDGTDVRRTLGGLGVDTPLTAGAVVHVLPSVAGG